VETGIDIIEIARIRDTIERRGERFLSRIFTPKERLYCDQRADPAVHYAGRWAAKEALYKALGAGDLPLFELEVLNREDGRPEVHLGPVATARFAGKQISISISHCKSYATAVAICTEG